MHIPWKLTTGKEWQSSINNWDKTFFLTSPWNWISPQKLGNDKTHSQHGWFSTSSQYIMSTFVNDMETYTDTQARSLEISLVFLNSLQRAKRSTQNRWLRKNKKERKNCCNWYHAHFLLNKAVFKQSCYTYFSCVVRISKELLASIWLSILRKGMDTL